ncbi:GIY-YIG nuclease family protein [Peptostreptococcus equinus]
MYTYIIRCKDMSLYCGYTSDIDRRFKEHASKIGAKYTRAKGVLRLEMYIKTDTKSSAMKLEYYIKKLSKNQKEKLIYGDDSLLINSCVDILDIIRL